MLRTRLETIDTPRSDVGPPLMRRLTYESAKRDHVYVLALRVHTRYHLRRNERYDVITNGRDFRREVFDAMTDVRRQYGRLRCISLRLP